MNTEIIDEALKKSIRFQLVEFAEKLLNIPYKLGAEWENYVIKPEFLDCSEMIEGIYRFHSLKMPDGSQAQFDFTVPTANPKIGDLAFFGKRGSVTQVYHVGLVYDEVNIAEARAWDPTASFPTGKVILRPRRKWEAYLPNFLGYRSHPKLI